MRTSKFTVEQISSALRRAEGGIAVAEICRELGINAPAANLFLPPLAALGRLCGYKPYYDRWDTRTEPPADVSG